MMYDLGDFEFTELTTPILAPRQASQTTASFARSNRPQPQAQQVRHVLILRDIDGERTIPLETETYSIGRHPANSIVLEAKTVSRHHAILLRLPDPVSGNHFFRVFDGDLQGKRSHNGIWVNGQRCFSHDLKHQDVIFFSGDVQATYCQVYDDDGDATPSLPRTVSPPTPKAETPTRDSNSDHELKHVSEAALLRLSSFPEMTPHPIIEMDLFGHITYLNPAAAAQFPDLREAKQHPLKQGLAQVLPQDPAQYHIREVEVGDAVYEQSVHCIPQSRLIRSYLVEITQRKQVEQVLRQSEERYAVAARGANDGLWDWDLTTDAIYFSPRWKAMIGYADPDIGGQVREWFDRIHVEDRKRVQHELTLHLQGASPHFEAEFRLLHRDGEYRWFRSRGMAIRDENDKAYRIAGSQTDITEYRLAKEQLLHDAFYDAMTGLPNRVLLLDRLSQAIKKCKRNQQIQCAVLFLDLDRFKVINDSLGHMLGDKLLVEVAQRLLKCVRAVDTVARLGGDEFVILLEDVTDIGAVIATVHRVQHSLKMPFHLGGQGVFTSASIGIAQCDPQYERPEELLRDADVAMYEAKQLGKDCYTIFQSAMNSQALERLQFENDLRQAIERQEFQLHYQPIMSLTPERLDGFEALIRWQHPERGLISPAEFIPLAEDTGLIIPLGWWVLQEACTQMRHWQQQYPTQTPLTIHVNISSRQFSQPDFVPHLQQILQETQLVSGSLKLEITEGVIMEQADEIAEKLNQIKALGVKLSIDDFGTGYSSLSYLHIFPVDTLKVDRSFVMKMGRSDSLEIVKTIITLAHNLELDVVAEGVETQAQAQLLKGMNCEYAQGYLFSRPVDCKAAEQLLATRLMVSSC